MPEPIVRMDCGEGRVVSLSESGVKTETGWCILNFVLEGFSRAARETVMAIARKIKGVEGRSVAVTDAALTVKCTTTDVRRRNLGSYDDEVRQTPSRPRV